MWKNGDSLNRIAAKSISENETEAAIHSIILVDFWIAGEGVLAAGGAAGRRGGAYGS